MPSAPTKLDLQFAAYLKKRRAGMSFADFSKETGLNGSTLFRIEQGEMSITLKKLNLVLVRLNTSLAEVFGDVAKKKFTRRD